MSIYNITMEATAALFVLIMMIGSMIRVEREKGLVIISYMYATVLCLLVCNIIVNCHLAGLFSILPTRVLISFNYFVLYVLLLEFYIFTQYILKKRGAGYTKRNHNSYIKRVCIISGFVFAVQIIHLILNRYIATKGVLYQINEGIDYFLFYSFWIPVVLNVFIMIRHRDCFSKKELVVMLIVQLGSAPFYALDMNYHTRTFYMFLALEVPLIYVYIFNFREGRMKELERQVEANRAELLAVQIHPHFVLNTLTTVRALCRKNPEEAIKALDFLSVYMQGILRNMTRQEVVLISAEIEFIQAYLEIQKMRYGKKLFLIYDLESIDFNVPALCLQPLVENAIRHGICCKEEGGTIRIRVTQDEEYYYLSVEDNGVGFDVEKIGLDGNRHIGIQNVRERLNLSGLGELIIESQIGVGTKASIRMPKGEKA